MDDKTKSIELGDLLDEIGNDIEELRKKNANDYTVRNMAMWWALEKSMLKIRHHPASVMKRIQRKWTTRWVAIAFCAGLAAMMAVVRLL